MHPLLHAAGQVAIKRRDGRQYNVGAIGRRQDGKLVHSRNSVTQFPNSKLHAEARLVLRLGKGAPVVYVARFVFGTKTLGMAKPCPTCEAILRSYGVRKVVYTTGPSSYAEMIL